MVIIDWEARQRGIFSKKKAVSAPFKRPIKTFLTKQNKRERTILSRQLMLTHPTHRTNICSCLLPPTRPIKRRKQRPAASFCPRNKQGMRRFPPRQVQSTISQQQFLYIRPIWRGHSPLE